MTTEQLQILSRVKAAYSNIEYAGFESGAFNTEDMGTVLDIIEDLCEKLECVKSDLEDIRDSLQMNDLLDQVTLELVESTMAFLDDVDV